MSSPIETSPAREFWESASGSTLLFEGVLRGENALALVRVKANRHVDPDESVYEEDRISQFEYMLTTCEPVLHYLLAHLPTFSILSLYRTSNYLRQYLRSYPLAWKTLSFRQPQPTITVGSPGMDSPAPGSRQIKHALDLVLKRVIVPIASRLTSLDLCNTSVNGVTLTATILTQRADTLQHLSVRGCKNVSLKYHIVPFLRQHKQEKDLFGAVPLALKSLYTYRCRHHRRRPYLPSSLFRRDSDSEPTHELIDTCHALDIWTDTAWCPTPGPRCSRRKDYHGNRAAPGTTEVWVPFDRLWRSSNRIGPSGESKDAPPVGKLWEEIECGQDGEPLGTPNGAFAGEGKHVPMHQRKSHGLFVQDVKCDDCHEVILERCETCSIKMHCMGCRKTLCSSCSFNKPYRRRRAGRIFNPDSPGALPKTRALRDDPTFWWAPGSKTSPNRMTEEVDESDSESDETPALLAANLPAVMAPLRFDMSWCCLEPLFSGGGGVAFVGTGLAGLGSERIRAVPLPKHREYLDPDFTTNKSVMGSVEDDQSPLIPKKNYEMFEAMPSLDLQATTCPRSLCQQCYKSVRWRLPCKGCNKALCKEHDFRALKVRKCGYRDLMEEREFVRNPPKQVREAIARGPDWQREPAWPRELHIPEFRVPDAAGAAAAAASEASDQDDSRRARATSSDLNLDVSDDGSTAAGPSTRDPSSAPLDAAGTASTVVAPGLSVAASASADRSSSVVGGRDYSSADAPAGGAGAAATRPCLRGRSVSMSELPVAAAARTAKKTGGAAASGSGSSSQYATERMLLPFNPGHPVQWQGCGEYFCQASRGSHDPRGRCSSKGYDCLECGVYVCEFCKPATKPCDCSFCDQTFHCPVCARKPEVLRQCTRKAEQAARAREAAELREQELERARVAEQERLSSDEVLGWGAEFWGGVLGEAGEAAEGDGEGALDASVGADAHVGADAGPAELEATVPETAAAVDALGTDTLGLELLADEDDDSEEAIYDDDEHEGVEDEDEDAALFSDGVY